MAVIIFKINHMNIAGFSISPIMSIVFGILILMFPDLLSVLVAIYLIVSGILALRKEK